MIIQECLKFLKSTKSKIVCFIVFLLSLAHTIDAVFFQNIYGEANNHYHPVYACFINGSSSLLMFKSIFIWLMPAFLTISYCDKYIRERKNGVTNLYFTKTQRKNFFLSKTTTAFIVPFFMCGIPHLFSLIVSIIFLNGNNGFADMQSWSVEEAGSFLYACINHPYLTYFIYLISSLIIFGLLGVICQGLIFIFEDSRLALIIALAIWLGIYLSNGYTNINYAMQPFNDGELLGFAVAYLSYLPMFVIITILAYKKVVVKKDEI